MPGQVMNSQPKNRTVDQRIAWVVVVAVALVGCSSKGDTSQVKESEKRTTGHVGDGSSQTESLPELWYVNYVLGERVGYERQSFVWITQEGHRLRKISGESRLRVKRANTVVEMMVRHTCWETPEGRPIRFEVETDQGGTINRTKGEVREGHVMMEVEVAGQTVKRTLPCPADCRGFLGLQESLFENRMNPGEQRSLTTFLPGLNDVATITLKAGEWEMLQLGERRIRCLAIGFTMSIGSTGTFQGRLWVNEQGVIVKQETDSPQMTTILVTRDEALEEPGDPGLDLVRDIRITVKQPASDLDRAVQAVYRMSSDGEDLSQLIPSDSHQTVKPVGRHVVELHVHPPSSSSQPLNCGEVADSSTTESSVWIQANAPEIVQLAQTASSGESDPRNIVLALAKLVYRTVKNKGYDHAFLSALEVAQRKEGDCTEHAVLLAALARARGLPARVAVGLVLQGDAFYYHMWTEVFIDGCWVGFDATRERCLVTPGYIKLAQDSLQAADGMGALLPAMKLMGQLRIEFVSVE